MCPGSPRRSNRSPGVAVGHRKRLAGPPAPRAGRMGEGCQVFAAVFLDADQERGLPRQQTDHVPRHGAVFQVWGAECPPWLGRYGRKTGSASALAPVCRPVRRLPAFGVIPRERRCWRWRHPAREPHRGRLPSTGEGPFARPSGRSEPPQPRGWPSGGRRTGAAWPTGTDSVGSQPRRCLSRGTSGPHVSSDRQLMRPGSRQAAPKRRSSRTLSKSRTPSGNPGWEDTMAEGISFVNSSATLSSGLNT